MDEPSSLLPEGSGPVEEPRDASAPDVVGPPPAPGEVVRADDPGGPEPAVAGAERSPPVPGTSPDEHGPAADEQAHLARENAQRLEREIESLRTGHGEGSRRQYRAFFEHERRLHGLFKDLRPLHAPDRHRLWNLLKQAGAEVRRAQQEEWESRRYQSIEARESIEEKLREAEASMGGAQGAADDRRADALLNEVRGMLGSNAEGAPGAVLIGPDRRACWDRWRRIRDQSRLQRGGLQDRDYAGLSGPVSAVAESAQSGDPFKAIQIVKELQARLGKAHLRRGQFEDLRRRLSEAWQVAQARLGEQRRERTQRRAEWRERMEGHVARWRETLVQKQGQREHLLAQQAKLEGMEQDARSEDFAAQVRGWKGENADKLRRVEEFIADLEERLRITAKKLGGHVPRAGAATGREEAAGASAPRDPGDPAPPGGVLEAEPGTDVPEAGPGTGTPEGEDPPE